MKRFFEAGRRTGLFASVGVAALAVSAPAVAQDATDDEAAVSTEEAPETQSGIIVTGSRIARPNLDSQVPVTILDGEEFFNQATINVGDTLNDLPQLRGTFSQTNAGRFLGTTGLNLLDLRGLGTQRTLTLVNGRRHVAGDILSNGTSPDVNTIPADLIQRVDIVTGGNSAIYGSDAIAGVVNFILREDFEGLQVRGQAGINSEGAFPSQYISALAGKNFADGRGNITLHGEFSNTEAVFGSDVSFLRSNDGFLVVDVDPAGLANGSDGFPDRVFFRDIRSAAIANNSLVPIGQSVAASRCGAGIVSTNGAPSTAGGTPYNCTFLFQNDGTLVAQTGTRVGTGAIGGIVGGNGETRRANRDLTVLPQQERININLLAHFDVSPAFVPFIEAKYVNLRTQGQQSSPAFTQGGTFGDIRERPRLDNPFLNTNASNLIASELLAGGLRSRSLTDRATLTAGDITAINNRTYRFTVARSFEDLGNRDEASIRDTYRIVAGARGDLSSNLRYEVSANYGEVRENTTVLGNVVSQRLILALDAARDPVTGNIVCRSQIDPAAATAYDPDNAGDVAALAAEIAACRPYNPFGSPDNSAASDYITQDTVSRAKLTQFVASGFVSGDTSGFVELPGGPVGFAVGGEYRRETLFFQADPIIESGRTFYNALPTFRPDPFEVKEAFAEIRIPLLADVPLFQELTLNGAIRVADYTGGAGTNYAYNGGFEWAPISDVRIRGQYGRSARAPNLTETSGDLSQNFSPGFSDPCLPQNIGNNPNRAANCATDLGALLNTPAFTALPAYSLEFLSGANPDLDVETSDSYTLGFVFQPSFLKGFSLTADYYDIQVNRVITSVNAATVVSSCYDLPSLDNQFCDLFSRFQGPGEGPNGEVPGQILQANLVVIPLNFAARTVRGIDTEVGYRHEFSDDVAISTRLIYTHLFERSNFEDPTFPTFENRILSEVGDPQDEFRWNLDLKLGAFNIGYQMQYIGPQVLNLYEDTRALPGATTPGRTPPPNNLDFADTEVYPAVFYHDVRFGVDVQDKFEFTFNVNNLLDTNPPLGLTGIGGGSSIYRVRGRSYSAGFLAKF